MAKIYDERSIRFIRKNGRVIPIHIKNSAQERNFDKNNFYNENTGEYSQRGLQ